MGAKVQFKLSRYLTMANSFNPTAILERIRAQESKESLSKQSQKQFQQVENQREPVRTARQSNERGIF